MSIVVGTDTYLSVADADTYWSDRNNSTWSAATTAEKEKALREAAQYLDGAYTFIGVLADLEQVLAWPRSAAVIRSGNFAGADFASDEIPLKIKHACAELALDALDARLRPTLERGGAVKREKVDVIEVEYLDFAPTQKTFSFVNVLLNGLTVGGEGQIKLVRC